MIYGYHTNYLNYTNNIPAYFFCYLLFYMKPGMVSIIMPSIIDRFTLKKQGITTKLPCFQKLSLLPAISSAVTKRTPLETLVYVLSCRDSKSGNIHNRLSELIEKPFMINHRLLIKCIFRQISVCFLKTMICFPVMHMLVFLC